MVYLFVCFFLGVGEGTPQIHLAFEFCKAISEADTTDTSMTFPLADPTARSA